MDTRKHLDLRHQVDELTALLASNAVAAGERAAVMEDEARAAQDLIDELRARGVVDKEEIAQLQQALLSARTIGMAMGILMVTRHVDQDAAFTILQQASSRTESKIRDVAGRIVATTQQNAPI